MSNYNHLNPDLHLHSVYSDGTDTLETLIQNVKAADVNLFALTDHDSIEGCNAIKKLLKPGDPVFVPGVELSCKDKTGKYHILGYHYDENSTSFRDLLQKTHKARLEKALNRFAFLEDRYGFSFTEEDKTQLCKEENPGKPHFVNLLMKKGLITDKDQGYDILSHYHGKEFRLSPIEAVQAIRQAGGIPVLAHGILADGSKCLTEEEITKRVDRLTEVGLLGIEAFYSTYTQEQKEIMLKLAKERDLCVTAGSDYHGANKGIKIGSTNGVKAELMEKFYEMIGLDRV